MNSFLLSTMEYKTVALLLYLGLCFSAIEAASTRKSCDSPNSPANGIVQCSRKDSILTCVGACNAGYTFETGEQSITLLCNDLTTILQEVFPKCIKSTCWSSLANSGNSSKITASSVWSGVKGYYFGPERAKLSSQVEVIDGIVQSGAWRSAINTIDQYVQVELATVKRIMGVVTKGRVVPNGDTAREYVTRYRILFSKDGLKWQPYSTKTVTDEFLDGNTDNTSPEVNMFSCPFDAKYVRINPLAWHENIAMRFDVLGCNPDGTNPSCSTDPSVMVPTKPMSTLAPTINVPTTPLDLCSPIPPPPNGMINCETMGDRLVCVANCADGYIFESRELLVKRACMRNTGVWPTTATLPKCIYNTQPTPHPSSSNFTNGCVTVQKECDNFGNGDFQACGGCHFFATCSEGFLYVRACPEALLFDDVSKVCDYHSRSCPDQMKFR